MLQKLPSTASSSELSGVWLIGSCLAAHSSDTAITQDMFNKFGPG